MDWQSCWGPLCLGKMLLYSTMGHMVHMLSCRDLACDGKQMLLYKKLVQYLILACQQTASLMQQHHDVQRDICVCNPVLELCSTA